MSRVDVRFGWPMIPVPLLPAPLVEVSGDASARRLGSVRTVSRLVAALRVGVILKVSPAFTAPPLRLRLKPSMTGAGSSLRS
ncbi:hypothetical protein D3C76_1193260 [compost metagenome]